MNLRDEATLDLKLQAAQFQKTLKELRDDGKDLQRTLKEVEQNSGKGSEEWKKYKAQLDANKEAVKEVNRQLKLMDPSKMTIQQLENLSRQLAKEMKNADRSTAEYVANAKKLGQVEQQLAKSKDEARKLVDAGKDLEKPSMWQKITSGVNTVGGAFKAMMALQVIGYIVDIGKAIFDATAKMEKYEKVLTTALGDNNEAAKQSLAAVKQMAKDTIFTVDELTEGYVKMVNRGMKPSQKEMTALADLAASQGKTFDQLVEAALDAQTGENERLKEFGILAKKSGDETTLSFKGMQQTVKNTPEAIQAALTAFGEMEGVSGQNAKMMETLNGKQSNLQDSFFDMAATLGEFLKPAFIGIFDIINALLPTIGFLGRVLASVVMAARGYIMIMIDGVTNGYNAIASLAKAGVELLSGNVEGAGKALDQAKKYGVAAKDSIGKNLAQTKTDIENVWVNPNGAVKAEFAGKKEGEGYNKGKKEADAKGQQERQKQAEAERKKQIEEEKKHLEEVRKANQDALAKLKSLEDEAYVETIKNQDGELAAERVMLMQKLDARLDEIDASLASEENKEKLRKATYTKFLSDIEKLDEKAAQEAAKKELEEQKRRQDLLIKRLNAQKDVLEQEKKAEDSIFAYKELQAQGNAKKLNEVRKLHLDVQLRLLRDALQIERQLEEVKIRQSITDEAELTQALAKLNDSYRTREIEEEQKTAEAKKKVDRDLLEARKKRDEQISGAFRSLLKGDLQAFGEYSSQLLGGINEQNQEWMRRIALVANMAKDAVNFLRDLAISRANTEIAEIQRAYDANKAIREQELADIKNHVENAAAIREQTAEETTAKILSVREQENNRILELEALQSEILNSQKDFDLQAEIGRVHEQTNTKIAEAERAKQSAVLNANIERLERTIAAEATRDAEIAAINARKDIDTATKNEMISLAIAKANSEINLANTERDAKIAAANETAQNAITQATLEKDEKILLMQLLVEGDTEKAARLIANAKTEGDEKVLLALAEKEEKMRIAEQENAERIAQKAELERLMHEEDKAAKKKQYELQLQAWKAQQRADIATAIINGALATVKALASGMFPLNLVFAAVTAGATAVQVAKIKNQPPPTPPSFRRGGLVRGDSHGTRYGQGGIALVERRTNREVGEMEGNEWIVPKDQVADNLPFLQELSKRSEQGISGPVSPRAYKHGGLVGIPKMFMYGGQVDEREEYDPYGNYNPTAQGDEMTSEDAIAAQEAAMNQGIRQLELLEEMADSLKFANERLDKVIEHTAATSERTEGVRQAIFSTNTNAKFDILIDRISSLAG